MFSRMLIPLDGSKTAEQVLPYARRLATVANVSVELLGVVEMTEITEETSSGEASYAEALIKEALRQSTEYLGAVAGTFVNGTVHCRVEQGRPEDVIITAAASHKDTLVAMATHGRSGVSRWLAGSVTEKVLRGTVNPLLVVHARRNVKSERLATLSSVIVPLDGSEAAESVLSPVADLAIALNLKVILVQAYGLPVVTYGGDDYDVPNYLELKDEVKKESEDYLNSKGNSLQAQGVASVSTIAIEGVAADAIINLSHETPDNLVALSSHSRSGLQRWVLGSVTEKVVRYCEDPVLVMRGA
jgi:nucleotide-binding universal stress UspA family protein